MGVSPNHAFYFRIFHEINQAFWSSSISGFTTKKRGFHKWGYSTPIAGWFNGESIYRWMKNGVPLWLRKPPYKYNSIHRIHIYYIYIYTIYIYTYILYILGGGSLQKWVAFECQIRGHSTGCGLDIQLQQQELNFSARIIPLEQWLRSTPVGCWLVRGFFSTLHILGITIIQ